MARIGEAEIGAASAFLAEHTTLANDPAATAAAVRGRVQGAMEHHRKRNGSDDGVGVQIGAKARDGTDVEVAIRPGEVLVLDPTGANEPVLIYPASSASPASPSAPESAVPESAATASG